MVIFNFGGVNVCIGLVGFVDIYVIVEVVVVVLLDWGIEIGVIEVVVCFIGLIGDWLLMDKLFVGVVYVVYEMYGGLVGGDEVVYVIMIIDNVFK